MVSDASKAGHADWLISSPLQQHRGLPDGLSGKSITGWCWQSPKDTALSKYKRDKKASVEKGERLHCPRIATTNRFSKQATNQAQQSPKEHGSVPRWWLQNYYHFCRSQAACLCELVKVLFYRFCIFLFVQIMTKIKNFTDSWNHFLILQNQR